MMPPVLPVAVHITVQASAVQCHKHPVPRWPYHLCAGMLEVLEMLHSPFTNWLTIHGLLMHCLKS